MAIPAFFVFVVVVSIVLLGVMGETDAMDSAHAEESTAPVESHPPAEPDMLVRGKR